ncbi:MAG: archaellin/type IV pilin N-terminal domain-containing protein [Candidatus Aenigmatarchaeota archaeon]
MKGVSTVIATILMLMITIALAGIAYIYISGVMTGTASKQIKVLDVTCTDSGGTAVYYVSIRNLDPRLTITSGELTFFVDGVLMNPNQVSMNDIPPAGLQQATVSPGNAFSIGTAHRVKVVGPANSEEQPTYC